MKRPILASDVPRLDKYSARISIDAPYANSLMKRWTHRSLVSRGEWRREEMPSSVAMVEKTEEIFEDGMALTSIFHLQTSMIATKR